MTTHDSIAAEGPRAFAVPDIALERFLVDDLPPDERAVVARAIAADPALQRYLDEREAQRRAFLFEGPRVVLPDAAPRGRVHALSLRMTSFAGAFAMACALLFVVVRDDDAPDDRARAEGDRADVRARGAALPVALPVNVIVRRDGRQFALAPGVPLRPGDALRVEVTSPGAGFVSAVLVDARGHDVVYDAVPVARGAALLPDSLVLDDVTGAEALHVVFTRARVPAASIAHDLAHDVARGAAAGDARAVVSWHKEPRP